MPDSPKMPPHTPATYSSAIEGLSQPRRITDLGPVAARFTYALRLIALHERARRDPVPELAARLGNMEIAAKSLALSYAIASTWPEDIHITRFCCPLLSHDEATIGTLIDCAGRRDSTGFAQQIEGLIRAERVHRLWDAVLGLLNAEMRAA